MGEVVVQGGIDLSAFKQNPIILWSHNPEHPIGTATDIGIVSGKLLATIEFAPEGVSSKADEICGLVKGGLIKTVSIGFDPTETEPMDPTLRKGPQRYLSSTLLEVSFVAIPANTDAEVIERATVPGRRREGRRISAATAARIKDILAEGETTMEHHRNAIASHRECMKALADLVNENELQDGSEDVTDLNDGSDGSKSVAFMTKAERLAEVAALLGAPRAADGLPVGDMFKSDAHFAARIRDQLEHRR
ncbi:MAG: HK97 family phage prohead protease [Aliidongia sp.]